MKKIVVVLFVLLGVVGSANEIDFGAWLVDKDLDFQGSESAVGVYPTMKDVKWLSGNCQKDMWCLVQMEFMKIMEGELRMSIFIPTNMMDLAFADLRNLICREG